MSDQWMPVIRMKVTREQFHLLPRNSAYKYEWIHGELYLTPRPKYVHAELRLADWAGPSVKPSTHVRIRRLREPDWDKLPELFRSAFHRYQPFQSLAEEVFKEASETCMKTTHEGGDGTLIKNACFYAYHRDNQCPLGAFLTTLTPCERLRDFGNYRKGIPDPLTPTDAPHITWIFVSNWFQREGIAENLLDRAVHALRRQNYDSLWTTMLTANESTLLWHWKMGFRLN